MMMALLWSLEDNLMRKSTILLLVVAVLFIGIGLLHKENDTVLNKGNNVCLECVGIG